MADNQHEEEGERGSDHLLKPRNQFSQSVIMIIILVFGFGMLIVIVVPCSLFYEHSLAARIFWWIFWVGLIGLGCLICLICLAEPALCPFGVLFVLLLAGMWCLGDYSGAYLITTADGVTPDTLQGIYYPEEVGLYKFKAGSGGGYVQSEPTIMYPEEVPFSKKLDFNFECHGFYVEQQCEDCTTDSNGYESCTTYDCGYYVYPDECPGYHLLSFAPLWARSGMSNGDPEHVAPAAILFQWRSFLMNSKQGVTDDFRSQRSKPFKVEMCQEDTLCAVDIRIPSMERKWDEWHANGAGIGETALGVGLHNYAGPVSHSEAWSIVKEHAPELFTKLGKDPEESTPVLWMPYEMKDAFEQFEQSVEHSQSKGVAAAWLLGISIGGSLVFALWVITNRAKYIHCQQHGSEEDEDEEMW